MKKTLLLLIILIFTVTLQGSTRQLLVVLADDFNSSSAQLQLFELKNTHFVKKGNPIAVNLGRNGLGWGIGKTKIGHMPDEPVKKEGDGRAPAGIFTLGSAFGYFETLSTRLPYKHASKDLICVDDSRSQYYNQIVRISPLVQTGSFEWMKRDDTLYMVGIIVNHNERALAGRGSCIFLHVEKKRFSPTSGCTSMAYHDLKELLGWLDPAKEPLLIQIPKQYCPEAEKLFGGICF
jgi:L,D-peptidoglycan transpeptidase YkuD (ErfK/YbiS/YcfS/YnhG family)